MKVINHQAGMDIISTHPVDVRVTSTLDYPANAISTSKNFCVLAILLLEKVITPKNVKLPPGVIYPYLGITDIDR